MLAPVLMWNKIGRIVMRLSKLLDVSPLSALDVYYTSRVCERMHNPEEELFTYSDEYIVDEILLELGQKQM